jgi:peptide deformylase
MKKIYKIQPKDVTKEDEQKLYNRLHKYCENNKLFAVSTQTIGKPYRAFYINTDESKLLLINPVIKNYSGEIINSQEVSEFDNLRKTRIVQRSSKIEVETDNLGLVVFEGNLSEKKIELNECIMAQQMIDLLDGIVISEKNINKPLKIEQKYDRNQYIIAKNPDGKIEQIKYKNVEKYLSQGYTIL